MSGDFLHQTVLLGEAVEALAVEQNGCYVDGTFGRGGHSRGILNKLGPGGCLVAIDKDPVAVATGELLQKQDARFHIIHGSFANLENLRGQDVLQRPVNGLLLDLGVSSPQLDDADRGFSFQTDGPLDMRMDTTKGMTAAEWLAHAEEEEIATVLKEYGEEKFARRIARAIVAQRQQAPLNTTSQLASLVAAAMPRKEKHKHPATRTFQAIRIQVNRELAELEQVLSVAVDLLAKGGRLVVISFHSLEDRIVKRFMRRQAEGERLPRGLPVQHEQVGARLKLIGKAVFPTDAEIDANPRARSAVMRVAEVL